MTSEPVFGDATPEDAWHPDDPARELLANLSRRLDLLGEPARRDVDDDLRERLADVVDRLRRATIRRGDLTGPDRVRLDLIEPDVDLIRDRLARGEY